MLSQIHGPSDYYKVKRRHFPFTLTPLEKTKPALPGAKCIATDHRETFSGGGEGTPRPPYLVHTIPHQTTICHFSTLSI